MADEKENPKIIVSDEKGERAPLAEEEGDEAATAIPSKVQAIITLNGVFTVIFLAMGLPSSAWIYAVDGNYCQGLFVYCVQQHFGDSVEIEDITAESSSEEENEFGDGCEKIDLDNQGFTLACALFTSVALSTGLFGIITIFLALWLNDLDSKRKAIKLSLYFFVISFITNVISLINYRVCFDDIIGKDPLGPFINPKPEYSFGWSYDICGLAIACQLLVIFGVGYSLLVMPVYVEVEDEEEGGGAIEEKENEEKEKE